MDESNAPIEVFANIGKSGGDTAALAEAIGRLISIALQKEVSVEEVSRTLMGITGSRPVWNEGTLVKSVPDGIGQILISEFGKKRPEGQPHAPARPSALFHAAPEEKKFVPSGPECPECGGSLHAESGCNICRDCGYSHCG
jgi:ribonucleoside-diphosphate reductase alpha chain